LNKISPNAALIVDTWNNYERPEFKVVNHEFAERDLKAFL